MDEKTTEAVKDTKKKLLKTEAFEKALLEGAEYKKGIMTTYKQQNKACFERFSSVMIEAAPEVKQLLEKRKKDRTDDDNERINAFKTEVRQMYVQAQDLLADEKVEEGKKSKVEKIVEKLVPVIMLLRIIKCRKLDDALAKAGFHLDGQSLSDRYPGLAAKESVLEDVFVEAKAVKDKVNNDNREIEDRIFTVNVPADLQYDKDTNNAGLKPGDFKKLVDAKAKLLMALTEEAKEKATEKIEHIASEKQFEAARAELVRDSLTIMQ